MNESSSLKDSLISVITFIILIIGTIISLLSELNIEIVSILMMSTCIFLFVLLFKWEIRKCSHPPLKEEINKEGYLRFATMLLVIKKTLLVISIGIPLAFIGIHEMSIHFPAWNDHYVIRYFTSDDALQEFKPLELHTDSSSKSMVVKDKHASIIIRKGELNYIYDNCIIITQIFKYFEERYMGIALTIILVLFILTIPIWLIDHMGALSYYKKV